MIGWRGNGSRESEKKIKTLPALESYVCFLNFLFIDTNEAWKKLVP